MPSLNPRPVELNAPAFAHLDEATQVRISELVAQAMPLQTLKRTGQRPLRFNGSVVATVCGVTPALPFWYELNVHRALDGRYLTDIRLFNKAPDEPDLFWVDEHDEAAEAIAHLERYDPAGDVTPPRHLTESSPSSAELALRIARLQLHIDQMTQHYRALVGELLHLVDHKAGAAPA